MSTAIAEFGMDVLRVTQGPNGSTSHTNRQAIDFGGAHTGGAGSIDKWYCTGCSWKVLKVQAGGDHAVYFQTTGPVLRANGTTGYVTMVLMHQEPIWHTVGQIIKPGQLMYEEGAYMSGTLKPGSAHIHCQVADGIVDPTLIKNSKGAYVLRNEAKVQDMLAVPDNVKITASGGLNWVRVSSISSTTNPTNPQEDEEVKLGVFSKTGDEFRTSLLVEQSADYKARMEGGKLVVYKRRIAREVEAATISEQVGKLLDAADILEGDLISVDEN